MIHCTWVVTFCLSYCLYRTWMMVSVRRCAYKYATLLTYYLIERREHWPLVPSSYVYGRYLSIMVHDFINAKSVVVVTGLNCIWLYAFKQVRLQFTCLWHLQ